MIELFDTSALIVASRNAAAGRVLAEALADDEVAITEMVLLEYLNGARNATEYETFETRLRATRLVPTEATDWQRAIDVHRQLAALGPGHQRSVRLPDLIIAAVAAREGLPIVRYDADYDGITAITGQEARWIVPRGAA